MRTLKWYVSLKKKEEITLNKLKHWKIMSKGKGISPPQLHFDQNQHWWRDA